jgi:hypothetical protein
VVHYTPNRWLVLTVTAVVAARIFYGVWRVWAAWQAGTEAIGTVAASGIQDVALRLARSCSATT